jgi:hypothetical protein
MRMQASKAGKLSLSASVNVQPNAASENLAAQHGTHCTHAHCMHGMHVHMHSWLM